MIIPVVLSGGNGTRLWPMSRQSKPKQFISFLGNDTMFTQTVKRFKNRKVFSEPIILGNIKHKDLIQEEMAKNKLKNTEVILEPKARNTAPAIAALVEYLHKHNKDEEIIIFLPSDAYIDNPSDLEKYLIEGETIAKNGKVVCFGIRPLYPETGYGYIKLGEKNGTNSYLVDRFVEKPDIDTAQEFVNARIYLWNAGIFMAKVSTLYKLFNKFQKELYRNIEAAVEKSVKVGNILYLDRDLFIQSNDISIDYAIIEKLDSKDLAVISMNLVWSDLGSYKSLYDVSGNKTKDHNIIDGKAVLNNTENCFIRSSKKVICCSDVDDLVIIEEPDTILIMKKDKSQNVKKLIEKCKEENLENIL